MGANPDPTLADLGFRLAAPSPALQPYIQSYWSFSRAAPLRQRHEEYMHPRGGYGLAFNFGGPALLDGEGIGEPIFLDGATTVSRRMGFLGSVEMLGVRFREGGAYPFLGVPLGELRNTTRLLDAVGHTRMPELYHRLYSARTLEMRVQLLDAWLLARLASAKPQDKLIPYSLAMLRDAASPHVIPQVADRLAISQRQLERIYHCHVGMSPKQYASLLRIDTARQALRRGDAMPIGQLAAELGFYDQSHFIREFRAVVGMPPSAYRARPHRNS